MPNTAAEQTDDEPPFCHTDVPWHHHDMEDATLCGPDHLAVADFNATSRIPGERQANADFARVAVNCHYDLVKALKEALDALRADPNDLEFGEYEQIIDSARHQAEVAIAKASQTSQLNTK